MSRDHVFIIVPIGGCLHARLVHDCIESSWGSLRTNRNGTHVVLKFNRGERPLDVPGGQREFTLEEIQTELEKPQWFEDPEA